MKTWDALQRLQNIKRFTGHCTVQQDTVAAHTLRVMSIVNRLIEEFPHPGLDKGLAMEIAMVHDIEESLFGDVPSPYKKYLQSYKKDSVQAIKQEGLLPPHLFKAYELLSSKLLEAELVHLADKLDVFLFMLKEEKLGNNEFFTSIREIGNSFEQMRDSIEMYYPYVDKVLGEVYRDWHYRVSKPVISSDNMDEPTALWISGC